MQQPETQQTTQETATEVQPAAGTGLSSFIFIKFKVVAASLTSLTRYCFKHVKLFVLYNFYKVRSI